MYPYVRFAAGYWLGEKDFHRRGIPIPMGVFLPGLVVGGILGGRLDHLLVVQLLIRHEGVAAFGPGFFTSGYTYFGGLLGGFMAFVAVSRIYQVPLLKILDGSAIVSLCYGIGRIGCFLAGDGDYGRPTHLPWGLSFPHGLVPTTLHVHPLPLYETAYAFAIFFLLWPRGRTEVYSRPYGTILADVLLWTGICRFCTQWVSLNARIFAGLTEAQLVSIAFMLGAFLLKKHFKQMKVTDRSSHDSIKEMSPNVG